MVVSDFLISSLPAEDSHFDEYFSDGWKPPTRDLIGNLKVSNHGSPRFGSLELRQSLDARIFFSKTSKRELEF